MPSQPHLVGTLLDGRYQITRLLGEGGMGQVYEGLQVALDRKVAVKVLHVRLAGDERFCERFMREARSASRIRHPNVVQILDFGQTSEGSPYFVMEFIEGGDLRSLIGELGSIAWPRARGILLQAVRALRAAHAKHIIHRDIKPGNCVLYDSPDDGSVDNVKLLDFGIAKLGGDANEGDPHAHSLTGTGEVFGTASYMAPEQAYGQPLDARSDVYSLGIMAYEMLTGTVPFTGANAIQVITRHMTDRPRPLRELDPRIPPAVEALVLKAIEKQPELRFASMAELEEALQAIPTDPWASMGEGKPLRADTRVLRDRSTSPGPSTAPITAVLDVVATAPPSTPLAVAVVPSVPYGGAAGVPMATDVVPSQPLLVGDGSSSNSHPQWRPSAGEVDAITTPHRGAESSVATGSMPRGGIPRQIGDTYPHSLSAARETQRPGRLALVLGLTAVLGGGGVTAAFVLQADEREAIGEPEPVESPLASDSRPESVADAELVLPGGPAERAGGPKGPGVLAQPIAPDAPSMVARVDEPQVDDPAVLPEEQRDVEPVSEVAAPATHKKPPPPSTPPRKKTDAQVKAKLEQGIARACGSLGKGALVGVELNLGSDGAILLKKIKAFGALKECVARQLAKARFPTGVTRKVELSIQL